MTFNGNITGNAILLKFGLFKESMEWETKEEGEFGENDTCMYMAKFLCCSPETVSTLKKAGKTARAFRYDLNQIPYDYTMEVRNIFKGLDLIERLKNYGQRFMTLYRRQGSRPSPREINAKRQNGCLRRPYK